MVYVSSAPAKRSEGDFFPFTVGIASMSCVRTDMSVGVYLYVRVRVSVSVYIWA